MARKTTEVGFESSLATTFEEICKSACEMLGVDHSGFVRFDPSDEFGEVVAQHPNLDGLTGQKVKLRGVPAEEELLNWDEPMVIEDVINSNLLGEVRVLLNKFDIRSVCIVKVRFHGVVIGSFSFDSIGKIRIFKPEEIAFCRYFTELASKIIEHAQFGNWLEAFQIATVAITSERESQALLKTIIAQAEHLFSVKTIGLYQRGLDDDGQEILRHAASSSDDLEGTVLRKGEGMAWDLILSKEPFAKTSDYDTYPNRAASYEGKFGSVLEVPLIKLDEHIGVVYLSDNKGREFTDFDAHLLQRFADVVTIALQHCNLIARMKALSIASTGISGDFESENLEARLTKIAARTAEILDAEMCGVFRVDDANSMVLQASYGHQEGYFEPNKSFEIKDSDQSGLTGAIAARLIAAHEDYLKLKQDNPNYDPDKRTLVFNASGQSLVTDRAVRGERDASRTGHCYSLLAIPLITMSGNKERVSGFLRINNKKGAQGLPSESIRFTDEDEWVLRIFAEAVVVAIASARLFDELKSQKDLFAQLLETWNTLASDDPLESRLEKIARNLVVIVHKSFCRILLSEELEESLTLKAAAVHPRLKSEESIQWTSDKNNRLALVEWPELKLAFDDGMPYELVSNGSNDPNSTLVKLSSLLQFRHGNSQVPMQVQSLFSIPMKVGTRKVGLLNIGELRSHTDRRATSRGKDRRSIVSPELTLNQKNIATTIAAQATAMIDREWREHTTKRREELFSRLSEGLSRIREETDSDRKLTVIAEQAKLVFGCQLGALLVQNVPGGTIKLVTASESGFRVTEEPELGRGQLDELLSMDPLVKASVFSSKFSEISSTLPLLANYKLNSSIAVRFEYAARSRCILIVGARSEGNDLSIADLTVLAELARHCSTSLTRAAIRDQLTNVRDGVNQIAIDLALGDQKLALKNVVKGIRTVTGCDAVTLYKLRASDNEIDGPPATDNLHFPEKAARYVRPAMDSPVGRIVEKNDLYTADDALTDAVMSGGFVEREGIKSSAGTPVWLPDTISAGIAEDDSEELIDEQKLSVGVLFINFRTPHKFTDDDKRILKMAAHLASLAIRNQDLFNQERHKAMVLSSLHDASKAISVSLDLAEVLDNLAEKAFRVAKTRERKVINVAIKLVENGKAKVHAIYPDRTDSNIKLGEEMDLNPVGEKCGIVGRAFRVGESQLVGNVLNDPDYREVFPSTNSQIVALIGEENWPELSPTGAITIESEGLHDFDHDDLQAFKSLAVLANNAIRNAQQFSDREYALDREANLKDLALYYVKCGILIHNQKTQVDAIKQEAERLSRLDSDNISQAEMAGIIEDIVKHSYELEAISNLAEPSAIQWKEIDLRELEADWRSRLTFMSGLGNVSVNVLTVAKESTKVRIDELLMRHVLKVFVDNSKRAMQGVLNKRLEIKLASDDPGWCSILITDSGKGIDMKLWETISAGKRPDSSDRPRKGLRTALLIITGFGGELLLERTSKTGSAFKILLPVSGSGS